MSEEEIIKVVKNVANGLKFTQEFQGNEMYREDIQAIQGLLDLYQKEKEKNKELENIKANTTIVHNSKEYNKWLKENYVSKDKIREEIEELEKQEDWYIENKGLDELYGQIDILKELLEEE